MLRIFRWLGGKCDVAPCPPHLIEFLLAVQTAGLVVDGDELLAGRVAAEGERSGYIQPLSAWSAGVTISVKGERALAAALALRGHPPLS